jgi:hypothetical protein
MHSPQAAVIPLFADVTALFPGAPEWVSSKALLCGAAAIGLFVLSLLLRGLQKVVLLCLALALIAGAFWFLQDAWRNKDKFLPPSVAAQLDALADKTLRSPQALAAWDSAKAQFAELTGSKSAPQGSRERVIAENLTTRATELRRQGHKTAAEELLRFRDQLKR